MTQHHVIAALGVAVGIVVGFMVWTYISPTISSVFSKPAAA